MGPLAPAPAMASDGPVFIVGCDRSGTTLLRLMLMGDPSLWIPTETNFIPHLAERSDRYGDFTSALQREAFVDDLASAYATYASVAMEALDLDPQEIRSALEAAAPTRYEGAVDAIYRLAAIRRGRHRWGDKSPTYVLHLPRLARLFPSARFVHLLRDARDVAVSTIMAGWFEPDQWEEAAEYWLRRVSTGLRDGRALGMARYMEIRYEALVQEPSATLRRLCDWCDLSYSSAMLAFYPGALDHILPAHRGLFPLIDKPVDPTRAHAWRRTMSAPARRRVERVAGAVMTQLEYLD